MHKGIEMLELQGKFNTAKVFTDNIEEGCISQVINLLNQDFIADSKVRIMPDCHQGAGCVIGFTANLGNKVIPNLIGVDISCGMLVVELGKINLDLRKLDQIIHQYVPSGRDVHTTPITKMNRLENLICYHELTNQGRFNQAIGTLGGGNHFIELDTDEEDNKYLVIHSGSRNLGKQVAEHYQRIAIEDRKGLGDFKTEKIKLIKQLKSEGKTKLIQKATGELEREFKNTKPNYPEELCYLEGEHKEDYLNDMLICQEYASLNRSVMVQIILANLSLDDLGYFETIHNYINFKDNIIRKGAVSANEGERLIIPINMRDGSIIAIGQGNPDWNNSAPHGAGRLMGRNEAKRTLSMDEFKETMKDIYSTTVNSSTLDEAPDAYKPMQEILDNIQDTVTIERIIKPIYNFKASE
jgi:tRNA-splicing ligase RtcB (3'-phosphate/5'-hydroxy nucleic acid ligase)